MRIYTSANLTPIRNANPYWHGPADPDANGQPQYLFQPTFHDPLISMGYDEISMLYVGTLNRAPIWAGQSGDPLKVGANFDWSKGGQCSFPPRVDAVQACAQLAANPGTWQCKSKPFMPLVFDIEDDGTPDPRGGTLFSNTMYYGLGATPAQRRIAAGNMVNGIRYIKAVNGGSPVGWYGLPGVDGYATNDASEAAKLDILDALKPVCAELDIICPSLYFSNGDGSAQNPDLAIVKAKETIALIRAEFPTLAESITVTLSPAFQIFWNDQKLIHLQGQPVPLPIFKNLVDVLDSERCDVLLWSDNLTWGPQFLPHCQYLASKAR